MKPLELKLESKIKSRFASLTLVLFLALAPLGATLAGTDATGGGGAMPWDNALTSLANNLTGKTALAVGLIAMFAAAAALVFGGEMSEFTRRMILMILAVSVMIGGGALLNTLFGFTGALLLP